MISLAEIELKIFIPGQEHRVNDLSNLQVENTNLP